MKKTCYGGSVIFGQASPKQIEAANNAVFNEKDFNKAVWGDTKKLVKELKEIIPNAIINGEGVEKTARILAKRMNVDHRYAIEVVRTETSRIMNRLAIDEMKDANVQYYRFEARKDEWTCEQCKRLDGKRFRVIEAKIGVNCPPIHPSCRCSIISDFGNGGDGNSGPDTSWISELFRKHLGEGTTAPVEGTTAPVEGTTAPVEGTTAPVEGTTAPVEGTTAPVE